MESIKGSLTLKDKEMEKVNSSGITESYTKVIGTKAKNMAKGYGKVLQGIYTRANGTKAVNMEKVFIVTKQALTKVNS